jgi:two-component system sensor histidine kinase RegB
LGTPLSTMSVIASEIEASLSDSIQRDDVALRDDVIILRRQLALCRDILQELRVQASGEMPRLPLQRFVEKAVSRLELLHPARRFCLRNTLPGWLVQPPAVLQQVVVNLLDNAAQASVACVDIELRDEGGDFVLDIHDDGPGVSPAVASRLGQPFVSDKQDGLGLGYFLSHASLNPLGGRIHLQARTDGGTHTELRLPWRALARQLPAVEQAS